MKDQEKKIEQTIIFGDCIWSQDIDFNNTDIDNDNLIDYAYEVYRTQSKIKKSNRLGFQSSSLPTTPQTADSRLKPLLTEVVSFAQSICYDQLYKNADESGLVFGVDSWLNINQKYAYNQPHIHGGNTLLSLIYYAQTPENCGNFYLTREDSRVDLISRFKIDDFFPMAPQIQYKPTPGKILATPGWVTHGVEQNLSDEDRISFAFNVNLMPNNNNNNNNNEPLDKEEQKVNKYAY